MSQIHIIDGQQDTILDYITAKHIIDDTHKKSLENTLETYQFITFADKRFSEHLEKRNRIIIPDEDESLVEFVIFEAAKYKDSEGHKAQVFAHASYLELKKASILYPSTYEGTASQHGGRTLNNTGWQIGIVEGRGTRKLTIENHTNPYEMLKRIAKEFELELRFRTEQDGNRITGRYVDLLERAGEWRGREVEFGKDLDGIRRVEKQDIVTALLGLGPEDEDGKRMEVLVEDEDALKRWGRIDEHGKLNHLIEPYEIQSTRTEMTEAEARQYTRTALDKRIDTQVTYETTIIDLEEVPGMENKKIRFGGTIKIKDTKFYPPLYLEARVFDQDRSIKSKAKKYIKLGDYIEYTEEEVNAIWKQLQAEIRKRVSYDTMMKYAEPKKILSDTPPTDQQENVIWVDTSQEPYVPKVYNFNEWQKMTPTEAFEVGAETPEGAQKKVDDLEIGGRNYVQNGLPTDNNLWVFTQQNTSGSSSISKGELLIANDDNGWKQWQIYSNRGATALDEIEGNDEYTLSFEAMMFGESATGRIQVVLRYNDADGSTDNVTLTVDATKLTNDWVKFHVTSYVPQSVINSSTYSRILAIYIGNGTVAFRKIQLEKGNKAQDYRSAPEDVDEKMKDASRLTEGVIDVDSVPLRTSVTGARITWDGINGLLQYDEDGNLTGRIDLDGTSYFKNGYFEGIIEALEGHFGGDVTGASGTFGKVSVNEGDITFKDEQSSTEFSLISKANLLKDHSFELVPADHDSLDSDSVLHNWLDAEGNNPYPMFDESPWERVRQPKVSVPFGADSKDALAIFGYKAIIVRNAHYVRQYVSEGISANSQYTLSAHFKRQWKSPTGGTPVLQVWHVSAKDGSRLQQLDSVVFPAVRSDYVYERHSLTFSVPSNFTLGDSIEIIVSGGNENWIQCDGAQLVEGDIAVPYDPEDSIWEFARGSYIPSNDMRSLWSGTQYPSASQTATPTKKLSKCRNGWIIKWQNYNVGSGTTNSNFEYVFIPKYHALYHNGLGVRVTLGRVGVDVYSKYIYVYDDRIVGHAQNGDGEMRNRAMTEVLEW